MLMYLIIVGGPTFAILYQGWRAWDYSHWWRAAQAVTLSSDYSDAERNADREPFAWLKPHPFADGRTGRRTRVRVGYADSSGGRHQATVLQFVRRGSTVKPTMQIFYDAREPDRVDVYGAFGAKIWMVIWGVTLVYILYRMPTTPALT